MFSNIKADEDVWTTNYPSSSYSNSKPKPENLYINFDRLVVITHGIGITMMVLSGFYFGNMLGGFTWFHNLPPGKCTAPEGCHNHGFFNFHGFLMSTAFIFFQGEALIIYRVYRNTLKIVSKTIHVVLHICAIICSIWGIIASNHDKKSTKSVQFYSFHSWVGLFILVSYGIQFIIGFVNYAYPKTPLWIRKMVMPFHRIYGSVIFHVSVGNVLMGHQRYICFGTDDPFCYALHTCNKRLGLILNFLVFFIVLYAICVIFIISKDSWKRLQTPDEKGHQK